MNVINTTAYATIGCDVQLSENDRLALGIELDKVTNWLETVIGDKSVTEDPYKAISNLVAFISKFAICPSQSNVFTASPEKFKKSGETIIADKSAQKDNMITVNISNYKNPQVALMMIIRCATGVEYDEINNCMKTAKEIHMSCIAFECTRKSKEEVVNELIDFGYTVVSNKTPSLILKEKDN